MAGKVKRQPKALNIRNVPEALLSMFKARCAERDYTQRDVILALMRLYVKTPHKIPVKRKKK